MKTVSLEYNSGSWRNWDAWKGADEHVQLIFIFADRFLLEAPSWIDPVRARYTKAQIVTASTAGEISGRTVMEKSAVAVLVQFEKTPIHLSHGHLNDHANSMELGKHLGALLPSTDLAHVFVISDGSRVNGDELIAGLHHSLPAGLPISGGLAGDYGRFEKTLVGLDADIRDGNVVLIGLYGDKIRVNASYRGGWNPFGPERIISKSNGNVLYEIDGENALDMYKKYLGKYADELPASCLLFPLSIQMPDHDEFIVRTILTIDEANKSMTFAGNLPQGSKVRFMKANSDELIHASYEAGEQANVDGKISHHATDLAILISCVGRKVVLGDRVEEEVEAASEHMEPSTTIAGFFSYGEIAPDYENQTSYLHNQTMTITTFAEISD
jgi:hypothetical protein